MINGTFCARQSNTVADVSPLLPARSCTAILSGDVVAILRCFYVTRDPNAETGVTSCDPLRELLSVVTAVILADEDQEAGLLLCQRRSKPRFEHSIIEFIGVTQPKLHTTNAFSGRLSFFRASRGRRSPVQMAEGLPDTAATWSPSLAAERSLFG